MYYFHRRWFSQLRDEDDELRPVNWQVMKRVLRYARPYRWQIILRGANPTELMNEVPLPRGWSLDIDPVGLV